MKFQNGTQCCKLKRKELPVYANKLPIRSLFLLLKYSLIDIMDVTYSVYTHTDMYILMEVTYSVHTHTERHVYNNGL